MPMNLGTIGAGGAKAGQDEFKEMLAERIKAAFLAQQDREKVKQQDVENAARTRGLDLQEMGIKESAATRAANSADQTAKEEANNFQQAIGQAPPDSDVTSAADSMKGNRYAIPVIKTALREVATLPGESRGATGPQGDVRPSAPTQGGVSLRTKPAPVPHEPTREPVRVETLGDGTVPDLKGRPVTAFMSPDGSKRLSEVQRISSPQETQANAQAFTEQQAGRKELSEKIEQPYQTAVSSANTLEDVVSQAKAGNKFAASLQPLEATMSAIRAQGLNRINSTEVGVSGSAGSLWDRIQGWFGKADSGQPVPHDIQDAMVQFAGILRKAAYKKYSQGFDSTTKRYSLTKEEKLAPEGAPDRGTVAADGKSVWDYRNGVWGWWQK